MTSDLLQSAFLVLFPAVILRYHSGIRLFKWVGPIVLCYGMGLVMANLPYITVNESLSKVFVSITVPLAIVLMVLPADIMHWLRYAGKAITSYLLCIVAVTISAVAAFFLFSPYTPDASDISGMLIGIYTGGTPNMSAIGLSLGVDNELFILLNSTEIVVAGVYLFFLLSVARPLLLRFLPDFPEQRKSGDASGYPGKIDFSEASAADLVRIYGVPFGIALLAVAASAGISYLFSGSIEEVVVILSVTTIGIALSFYRPVRKLRGSYPVGEYILMIFCIAIGSLANMEMLIEASAVIFLFVTFVTVTSILIHYILARFFKIDVDTLIITSAAGIFSPAFVPAIARAIKNEEIVISGLTTGMIGYAIGTYWGVLVAWLLS